MRVADRATAKTNPNGDWARRCRPKRSPSNEVVTTTRMHNTIRVTGDGHRQYGNQCRHGANNIQDGSFDNASGVLSVVQNTGANVLIQSATIVNVQFTEP